MTDRIELLEAALDSLPEGVALLGLEGEVLFWNKAAEAITGFASADLMAQPIPAALEPLLQATVRYGEEPPQTGRKALINARHKLGHVIQALTRVRALYDGLGEQIGTAVLFHPAESLDVLPHGETDESVETSQTEFEDRLAMEFDDFISGGLPFGVLWISVDQAQALRKTHGAGACAAMLDKVERALAQGLRPAEVMGRWGEDDFLVISHERTQEMLAAHAQVLAGLARTANFRWWGDRVSLTVSIGAAQADQTQTLAQLLDRAQTAMESSIHAGGNHITPAPGVHSC
jgi:diguanylate cyclase (GGDEF)-like protein/PAS domain S-box-containing protein